MFNPVKHFENNRWSQAEQKIEFRHRAALELLPKDICSLLDIGCGEGIYLSMVSEKFSKISITGVDLSEVALQKTQERDKNIKCILVDASGRLPFKNEEFDVVTALDILEHSLEPNLIISEMKRVAKKGIIISVPNFSSFPARLQMMIGKIPENNKPNKGHMYWFNKNVLQKLVTENKLIISKELSNHQLQNSSLFGPIIKMIKIIFPNIFALSFVVFVEKAKN